MNSHPEWIVTGLLRATLGLSVATVLVAFLIRLLRLRAPRVEQCVWALVLVQGALFVPLLSVTFPARWLGITASNSKSIAGIIPVPVEEERPFDEPDLNRAPMPNGPSKVGSTIAARTAEPIAAKSPVRVSVHTPAVSNAAPSESQLTWTTIAYIVWLVGMACFIALGGLRYLMFVGRLRKTKQPCAEWQNELQSVLERRRVSRRIGLVVSDDVGPALCLMPTGYRIVVPRPLWEQLSPPQRCAILRHEIAHFVRRDLWTALLVRGVALMHWFNPMAWWAAFRFEAQAEFACDGAAASDDQTAFAAVLIHLGSVRPGRMLATQSARNGNLAERIKRLLSEASRSPAWKNAIVVLFAALALLPMTLHLKAVAQNAAPAEEDPGTLLAEPERPAKLLVKLGNANLRAPVYIRDIAFSLDGKLIAAVGHFDSPWVGLFDVVTGSQIKQLAPDGVQGQLECVSFSPDQSKLLWGDSEGNIALWDVTNDQFLFRKKIHDGTVNAVAFTANGEQIASAGGDGRIHLMKTADPKTILHSFVTGGELPKAAPRSRRAKTSGNDGAACIAFAMNDTRLVAGSAGNVFVWNIATHALERQFSASAASLTVMPDDKQVMVAGSRYAKRETTHLQYVAQNVMLSQVGIWDVSTGAKLRDLHGPEDYGNGYAAVSRDGKRVAVADVSLLRILDAQTGKAEHEIPVPGARARDIEFSPDGTLVAMPILNTIGLFDVNTGKRLLHDEQMSAGQIVSAAWSTDGNRIVTGHDEGDVRVWNAQSGELIWSKLLAPIISRDGYNSHPAFVAFTPDGKLVIAAGRRDDPVKFINGIIKFFDAADGKVIRELFPKEIRAAALSSDGRILLAGQSSGGSATHLIGVDVGTGKILYSNPPAEEPGGFNDIKAIQFQEKLKTLQFATRDGEVILFDAQTGKEKRQFIADWRSDAQLQKGGNLDLWSGMFSADGRTFVSSREKAVYVWDLPGEKLERRMRTSHGQGCEISVTPDGKTFAVRETHLDARDGVRLYDVATGDALLKVEPDDDRATVHLFSPDGKKLFTGYFRGSAAIWDVAR